MLTSGEALTCESTINVNKWFEDGKLKTFHWVLLLLGLGCYTFIGYCLLGFGTVVPLLLKPFHLNLAQAGVIGSYASIGAAIGSLFWGAVADKIGRRRTILICLTISCVGMGLCGISNGPGFFSIFRVLVGFGVGGCMPNMVALASEYLPLRDRATTVSVMQTGIQVGSMAAALLGLWLFTSFGWRTTFVAGFVPIILLPVYAKYLPESPVHLFKHGRIEQLRKYVRLTRPSETVPDAAVLQVNMGSGKAPLAAIFQDGRGFSTVAISIAFFMNMYTIYAFVIWLPKLMMSQGFSLARGLSSVLSLSIATIIGSYVAGIIADRLIGYRRTLFLYYGISFVFMVASGYMSSFAGLMICVSLGGAGICSALNVLNAYVALYYPPTMRSTALGFCGGAGLIGSIFGPAIIGILMNMHFTFHETLLATAIPGLVPALAIWLVREKHNYAHVLAAEECPRTSVAVQQG